MSFFTLSDSPAVTLFPLSAQQFSVQPSTFSAWVSALENSNVPAIQEFTDLLDDWLPSWKVTGSLLSQPVSAVQQPVHWPLLSYDGSHGLNVSGLPKIITWKLNGEAALTVESTTLPEQLQAVTGLSAEQDFLRYSFSAEGCVELGAQVDLDNITSLNLAAAVAASACGNQQVISYFSHAPSTYFYDALLRDGAALADLLSLDAFRDNMLGALVIKREGELAFSSEVGVRVSMASSNKTGNLVNLELPKASFELEHAWSMKGAFDVLMYRPAGYDGVRLRVLKASSDSSATRWSFNAGMKFTGLTERVSEVLNNLGDYPKLVSDWLQKVTLFHEHLDSLLVAELQKLPTELHGLLPKLTGTEAIDQSWVIDELKQLLEEPVSQVTLWQKASIEYQDKLENIAERLFGENTPKAVIWLAEVFDSVENQVLGKSLLWLDELIQAQGDLISENLLEPLAEVDDRFEALFDELETVTDAFRRPFLALLEEFQRSLQSLSQTVQQTMTDELQLVYSLNESKLREHSAIVDVSFPFYDISTEEGQLASSLLGACLSGNFQPLLACHRSGDEHLKSLFTLEHSAFSIVFTSRQDSQLLLNVFGWKLGRRRLFEQFNKLEYSGDGVMSVAEAGAKSEFESGAFCLRVNSFANIIETRESNLVVSLRYEDDLLEHTELNRLLSQLHAQELVSEARCNAIRQALLDEMYLDQNKECALQVNLSVMPSYLEKALQSETLRKKAQEVALQALSTAWERYMGEYQKLRYKRTIAVIKAYKPSYSLAKNILALGVLSRTARRAKLSDAAKKIGITFGPQGSILASINPAAKFVEYAFSMSQEFVKLIEAFQIAHAIDIQEAETPKVVSEQLTDVCAKFEDCFEDWVDGFGYFPGIDEQQIHPGQLAMFIALMQLTGIPTSALNVKLVLKSPDKASRFINC